MPFVKDRVKKHRLALRARGLRTVQLWVPDTRSPSFKKECQRQVKLVATHADASLARLLDGALVEVNGWQN